MNAGRFIGCMTGTSVDGLDLALIEVESAVTPKIDSGEKISVLHAHTQEIPQPLRGWLLACGQPDESSIDLLGRCDSALGAFIGRSVHHWLKDLHIDAASITAIGSHGQTVRHRPPGQIEHPFTLQIGDPNRIAELTGIDTVADFRRRDMAVGGQGAPLAPAFHRFFFDQTGTNTCVVNIGGICNISPLQGEQGGFDSGPGNCLLDDWYVHNHPVSNLRYDPAGAWAATGEADANLLQQMLAEPYFAYAPPKSTGREHFNLEWLNKQLVEFREKISPQNIQATLVDLTAVSLAKAITDSMPSAIDIPICGGGRHNQRLMRRISAALSSSGNARCHVRPSEHWGIDGDSVEAAAFAWLAYRRLNALPGNVPSVTGAASQRTLGAIYPGLNADSK